jgi:hypothetical protein
VGPFTAALYVLQSDEESCLGFVPATLQKVKIKLQAVPLALTKPLHGALLMGINKRPGCLFDGFPEFLIALVSHQSSNSVQGWNTPK